MNESGMDVESLRLIVRNPEAYPDSVEVARMALQYYERSQEAFYEAAKARDELGEARVALARANRIIDYLLDQTGR